MKPDVIKNVTLPTPLLQQAQRPQYQRMVTFDSFRAGWYT